MSEPFQFIPFPSSKGEERSPVRRFGPEQAEKVHAFHASFPGYAPTPLADLRGAAAALGVASIHVKDESQRFGLNAFKVLGGSYAIGRYIAGRLGLDIRELPYQRMTSPEIRAQLGDITFVTATDGNHGRGVAWTANRLGQKSVVLMPKGSAPERLENIRKLGAEASITDLNYDDTVRLAKDLAEKNGWVTVQDTTWEGYEEIPGWIMEGYTTLAYEIMQQLEGERPTHIFLQAGVGVMAGSITGFFSDLYAGQDRPIITVVEPENAACIFRTAQAGDGALHAVKGDLHTIMAGLACGEPCSAAWNILRDHADYSATIPDWAAAKGMRILGAPLPGDPRVISGESGASTMGFVAEVLQNDRLKGIRETLGLDGTSRILCISTEGDTDRSNYQRIVWDGAFPSF